MDVSAGRGPQGPRGLKSRDGGGQDLPADGRGPQGPRGLKCGRSDGGRAEGQVAVRKDRED